MIKITLTIDNLLTCLVPMTLAHVSFTSCLKSTKAHSHGQCPTKSHPADPASVTVGLSPATLLEYIDHFINPLAKLHPSYIKKLKSLVPTEAFLFTIDVDALYTNIDTR